MDERLGRFMDADASDDIGPYVGDGEYIKCPNLDVLRILFS